MSRNDWDFNSPLLKSNTATDSVRLIEASIEGSSCSLKFRPNGEKGWGGERPFWRILLHHCHEYINNIAIDAAAVNASTQLAIVQIQKEAWIGGSDPCQDLLVDLILCTEANLLKVITWWCRLSTSSGQPWKTYPTWIQWRMVTRNFF